MNILLVEDEEKLQLFLKDFLVEEGLSVITADSVATGREEFKKAFARSGFIGLAFARRARDRTFKRMENGQGHNSSYFTNSEVRDYG